MDCSPPPLQPSQPTDQGIFLCNLSEWLGPQSKPVSTFISLIPAGQLFYQDESTSFPSEHPGGPRLGHLEGVTKPEQAGRANGVHTEVSVGRQGLPPVAGFVLPAITPAQNCLGRLRVDRSFAGQSI